jgi:hypothetical protein
MQSRDYKSFKNKCFGSMLINIGQAADDDGGGCLISNAAHGFRMSKEILAFVFLFGALRLVFQN